MSFAVAVSCRLSRGLLAGDMSALLVRQKPVGLVLMARVSGWDAWLEGAIEQYIQCRRPEFLNIMTTDEVHIGCEAHA